MNKEDFKWLDIGFSKVQMTLYGVRYPEIYKSKFTFVNVAKHTFPFYLFQVDFEKFKFDYKRINHTKIWIRK